MALETKKEGNIITELASSVRLPKMVKVNSFWTIAILMLMRFRELYAVNLIVRN